MSATRLQFYKTSNVVGRTVSDCVQISTFVKSWLYALSTSLAGAGNGSNIFEITVKRTELDTLIIEKGKTREGKISTGGLRA